MADAIKFEIKKYLKRERGKALPESTNCWDFNCKFGSTANEAKVIEVTEIGKAIDEANSKNFESFYLEIIARPGYKPKRTIPMKKDKDSIE